MTIDDPVGITIRQAQQDRADESYLPSRLAKLGISATAAAALVTMPFVSQIITTLLSNSPSRFEERFLRIAAEMDAQQKRIEGKIPDTHYYESEEFQTLIGLILERIHTTHSKEKLETFGAALANSGSAEFDNDDKEGFIRILRDLSLYDLQTLQHDNLKGWKPFTNAFTYGDETLSSLSRLAGFGLVHERTVSLGNGESRHNFALSGYGERFLKFIEKSSRL